MKLHENNVVITSNLFRPHFGGVENSLYHLAKAYLSLGYRPIVVVSDLPTETEQLRLFESLEGIKILRYQMTSAGRWLGIKWPKSLYGIISAVKTYRWIKREFKPQAVITRYHFNQVFAWLAGLRNTIYLVPGVVKFQNSTKNLEYKTIRAKLQWYYHRILQYIALRSAFQVAVFSNNMHQQLRDVGYRKDIMITKPGVDTERFLTSTEKNDRPTFLCVGRCVKAKGFYLAIEAMKHIENARLWIVGDGPLLENYRKLAEELGVNERVVFWGAQSTPESFYAKADYFLMTSTYEPLGQTILEALAAGLPIVAFKPSEHVLTATLDVLGKDGAVYAEKCDAKALSDAMQLSLSWDCTEYEEVSSSNRKRAIKDYSWETLARTLIGARN